jgi:sodium-dependent dicarboxylate transporter 2/3/5
MPENQSAMILMTATVAASYAFMLPIATPPNAIVMSSRVISIKEMAAVGLKLNLIGVTVLGVVAYVVWGWLLG